MIPVSFLLDREATAQVGEFMYQDMFPNLSPEYGGVPLGENAQVLMDCLIEHVGGGSVPHMPSLAAMESFEAPERLRAWAVWEALHVVSKAADESQTVYGAHTRANMWNWCRSPNPSTLSEVPPDMAGYTSDFLANVPDLLLDHMNFLVRCVHQPTGTLLLARHCADGMDQLVSRQLHMRLRLFLLLSGWDPQGWDTQHLCRPSLLPPIPEDVGP